jgi:dihydropyrimidine dehydrogenase (NADP+)
MMDRAFDLGWGFGVTKTYSLDKDMITNVSPRIVGTGIRHGSNPSGYTNIELISEKTARYWVDGVKELKAKHPEKVVISSIMAGYSKEDWQELALLTAESGCDMMELNLSCPHGMGERGMGLACGEDPVMVEEITRWVVDVVPDMPIFPKMTPNVTNIRTIAGGAYAGGAAGVTAINTVASIQDLKSGLPWPSVGATQSLTPGGGSGVFVRPIALRMVSEIARELPDFPILATGGIDSAETALNFLRMGASAVQISSAIQNQDLTVIEDYITGLKALLYLHERDDLHDAGWHYQAPPYAREEHVRKELPRFGAFEEERIEANLKAMKNVKANAVPDAGLPDFSAVDSVDTKQDVPRVEDVIGTALVHLTDHMKLSIDQHVVAEVNEDLCINCGRCMLTCNDTGYQAIHFSTETHAVNITDSCTGCGLCGAVCPVAGCIDFVPRETPYTVYRGTVEEDHQMPPELLDTVEPTEWATPANKDGKGVIRSPGYQ